MAPFEEKPVNGEYVANPVHSPSDVSPSVLHKQLNWTNLTLIHICTNLGNPPKYLKDLQNSLNAIQSSLDNLNIPATEHIEIHQGAGDVSDASEDSQNEESSDVILQKPNLAPPAFPTLGSIPGTSSPTLWKRPPFGSNRGFGGRYSEHFVGRSFGTSGGFQSSGLSSPPTRVKLHPCHLERRPSNTMTSASWL